jgi:DNA-binding NarL/FixJ family response regulator
MSVKVVLIDDHPMVRQGLRQLVSTQPNLTLVGEACNGSEALKLIAERSPDLIVIDLHLPGVDGIEVTRQALELLPTAKILVFSADANQSRVDAALEAGACGYLVKNCAIDEMLLAIETIMSGRLYLSSEISAQILEGYRRNLKSSTGEKSALSAQERMVLRSIAEGLRTKEIALQMKLSVKTVETYRRRLITKLKCDSTADLVRYALREGIVEP